jgi:peroxiredoxin
MARGTGTTEGEGRPPAEQPVMSDVLTIGKKAPDFEAQASDGKTYRLADLLKRTHVLLVFYPGNNTPG